MKWSARVSSIMCSAALLLPLPAAAESQIHADAPRRVTASAHVDFKIVIPKILSMEVLSGIQSGVDVQRVAIGSNGRMVVLAATVQG